MIGVSLLKVRRRGGAFVRQIAGKDAVGYVYFSHGIIAQLFAQSAAPSRQKTDRMNHLNKGDYSLALVSTTVLLTVYYQLVAKWRVRLAGVMPAPLSGKARFLFGLLTDPWIISGVCAAFIAGLSWMTALTKLDLNYAYPFMSLAFVLVFLLGALLFHETVTTPKVLGLVLVVLGLIVSSKG